MGMSVSLIAIVSPVMQLCSITAVHSCAALCFISANTLLLISAILLPLLLFYVAIFSKVEMERSSLLAKLAVISGGAALLAIPVFIISRFFFAGKTGFAVYYGLGWLAALLVAAITKYLSSKK